MSEKQSININIAERYYPLTVDRKDEERIRKAAKIINDKILQYKQIYKDKDIQDFLAMVTLQFTTKYLESEELLDENPVTEKIKNINEELEEFLHGQDKVLINS
ncbi:MAG: cell division protein ZapA [Bacteroidales bacterium]|jgi:cell division protein ZapA|nr:cell division protein ZapA [Bacteroidales bacterium]